jgi:glycosyltransferase involved in cell wall biosynthesis
VTDPARRAAAAKRYGLPADAFTVGSVGRLEPEKNYSMLLRAFALLAAGSSRPACLVLVGEGSRRAELEAQAAELGIADRVRFLGMQYRVSEILPLLDVFVLTSLTEGTSISLLEAQASGVPAVVTDVGGNGFIVRDGENGFLCAVNDDTAMAEMMCRLRDEPALARRMAEAARRRVRDGLDLGSMVRGYEHLYRRLASVDATA